MIVSSLRMGFAMTLMRLDLLLRRIHLAGISSINNVENKADEVEIFEEIISMLHCFSMKMYSKRRRKTRNNKGGLKE